MVYSKTDILGTYNIGNIQLAFSIFNFLVVVVIWAAERGDAAGEAESRNEKPFHLCNNCHYQLTFAFWEFLINFQHENFHRITVTQIVKCVD